MNVFLSSEMNDLDGWMRMKHSGFFHLYKYLILDWTVSSHKNGTRDCLPYLRHPQENRGNTLLTSIVNIELAGKGLSEGVEVDMNGNIQYIFLSSLPLPLHVQEISSASLP